MGPWQEAAEGTLRLGPGRGGGSRCLGEAPLLKSQALVETGPLTQEGVGQGHPHPCTPAHHPLEGPPPPPPPGQSKEEVALDSRK